MTGDIINKMKGQAMEWNKTAAMSVTDRWLVYKLQKDHLQVKLEKWEKVLSRHVIVEETHVVNRDA